MQRHRLHLSNLQLQLDRQNAENNIAVAQYVLNERRRRMRRRRAVWVRPWLQRRNLLGQYERLMSEIRDEDLPAFKNFVRVEQECFMSCLSGWVTELARRTRGTERPWFKPGPHAVVPCHQHCSTLQIKGNIHPGRIAYIFKFGLT